MRTVPVDTKNSIENCADNCYNFFDISCDTIEELSIMCTQQDAIKILYDVQSMCNALFPVKEVYLYGSYARGDYHSESDIDFLVTADLLSEEISKYRRQIALISSELSMKNDVTVSVTLKPEAQFKWYSDAMPFYRNVKKEGIKYAG